jgi:cobalamin biosynthesis protein CbiD
MQMISDETRPIVETAREMLRTGINIQATGEATNAIVTGLIEKLLAHIDELEADLKVAVALGRAYAQKTSNKS